MRDRLPAYFDPLIAARRAGQVGRNVHLGYWDKPPSLNTHCTLAEFEAAQARLTEQMLELAPLHAARMVLDVGCGFGGLMAMIGARFPGLSPIGVNIDRRQLELCRGVAHGLVQSDACALPFSTGAIDHMFCVEAMFHFGSRPVFLAEAARVLRRGGVLAVTDILLQPPADSAVFAATIRRDYGPWPELWIDPRTLLHYADDAGFDPVIAEDWTAATLPSYRFITPQIAAASGSMSAGEALRWSHERGLLTYQALTLRRR